MSEKELAWDFDSLVHGYDSRVAIDNGLYAEYEHVLNLVVQKASLAPDMSVIDIVAGTGNLSIKCAATGAHVIAMDPSGKMLEVARQKLSPKANIEFVHTPQPFMEIPCPDSSVDAVVSTYAFHHIHPDKKKASIAEMLRVLKAGGRLVLGDLLFADRGCEESALQQYSWLEQEYFTRIDGLQEIMKSFGLGIECHQVSPVTWVVWVVNK